MSLVILGLVVACAANPFVPACIAEQCNKEAMALATDGHTKALGSCLGSNFGPCGEKAWNCLGDPKCRSIVACGPSTFNTCKQDIWEVLTNPAEREKIMCLLDCTKNGTVSKLCAIEKCSKDAVLCLEDSTCRHAAECVPKSMLACTKSGFECLFSSSMCRDNLKCLAHGVSECASPGVNMLTDTKIADFVTCAGSKCPHPISEPASSTKVALASPKVKTPTGPTSQLVCIAAKCGRKVLNLFEDDDTRELMHCASKATGLPDLCSSVWQCLGNQGCEKALGCWSKPFDSCTEDIWHMFTDQAERQRIEAGVTCMHNCSRSFKDDAVQMIGCVLDNCGRGFLDCYNDQACSKAVKCMPATLGECLAPQFEEYLHDKLFRDSTMCVARGLETCGRKAVEILRNKDIADAVTCAAQCGRPVSETTPMSDVGIII